MKQIVSLIALCLAPHLWAQTPFENIIQYNPQNEMYQFTK